MLEAARRARAYLADLSAKQFLSDPQRQDAVVRRLEMLGEAARRTSDAARPALPEIPWEQIVGMRNFLIHQYDTINFTIVWDTVQSDLPTVIEPLERHFT